jgi:iron complex outermembrane recepter protein
MPQSLVVHSTLSLLFLLPAITFATDLTGVVLDPNRAPIAGASVTLTSPAKTLQTTTSNDGRFAFTEVPPAYYDLSVQSRGLESKHSLNLAETKQTVEILLSLSPRTDSIEVLSTPERTAASKLDIPLSELPVTVDTLNAEQLRQQGNTELVSALRYTNNVYSRVHFGVYEHFTVRGFGDVIQMVDGVRQEDRRFNTQIVNVEQVEVLKGPAAALYGNNALGGALNVIRKKPKNELGLEASLAGGTWDNRRASFGITGPLIKNKLLARIDYGFVDFNGFRGAPIRQHIVTPSLLIRPTRRDQLSLNYQFNNDRFATDSGIPTLGVNIPSLPPNFRYNTPFDRALTKDNFLQAYYNRNLGEAFDLRNVFSYRRFTDDYLSTESIAWVLPRTLNRTFFYFDRARETTMNQLELTARFRLAKMSHTFLGGYEYQRFSQEDSNSNLTNLRANPIDLFAPSETQSALPGNRIDRTRFIRQSVHAPYFQDHIRIGERLQFTVNARFDPWRRQFRTDQFPMAGGLTTGPTTRLAQNATTFRIGGVYRLSSLASVYGSYGTGFTPVLNVPIDGSILDPERGRQGEAGIRLDLFQRRVLVTSALFYLYKENATIALGGGRFTQAGRQRAQGWETTIEGYITRRLNLRLAHGLTDAKYLEFFASGQNLAGRVPIFAPRHTGSAWATYQLGKGFALSLGMRATASAFPSFFNTAKMPGYALLDGTLSYTRKYVDVTASMQNLANRTGYFVSSVYNTQLYPGTPFGMLVTTRFRWN